MREWFFALSGWLVVAALTFWIALPYATVAAVSQPVAFNHRKHVQDVGLECLICHSGAATAARAGIPTTAECLACHETLETTLPEAKKVAAYGVRGEEIRWNRVYHLPPSDTIPFLKPYASKLRFSHRRHVSAGKIECVACHGKIAGLTRPPARPDPPIRMARCLACHRERHITTDCLACHR